jgi:hypothetical protein
MWGAGRGARRRTLPLTLCPQPSALCPMTQIVHHASGALDFTDSVGIRWTVSEIARLEFSERLMALLPHPERRQGWLLFESELGERRRYTPIPNEWRTLKAPALEECLTAAIPAPQSERRRRDDGSL